MNTLQIKALSQHFLQENQVKKVFSNLHYTFSSGVSYAIMGPSGSGKSTLLHLIAGIDTPSYGHITLNGNDVSLLEGKQRALSLAVVLQSSFFINELSVLENCALAGLATNTAEHICLKHAEALLGSVGLSDYKDASIGVLSGGQRQRAALARALMNRPHFIILDELTGNLDTKTAELIVNLLKKLQSEYGFGIIATTHDPLIATHMDVILLIEQTALTPAPKQSLYQKVTHELFS